jgi:hypothetical protein
MNSITKPSLHKRSLNVLIMLFSFSLLPFSGIIIHSTHGMSEKEPLRHFAMSVHNLSAIIFFISCVIHLLANRRALAKYISEKRNSYLQLKREAVIALLIVFVIVGVFSLHAFHVK